MPDKAILHRTDLSISALARDVAELDECALIESIYNRQAAPTIQNSLGFILFVPRVD